MGMIRQLKKLWVLSDRAGFTHPNERKVRMMGSLKEAQGEVRVRVIIGPR